MIASRDTALTQLSALAARPSGHRIARRCDADPTRAGRFSATPDVPPRDDAKPSIGAAARDALLPPAEAARLRDGATRAPIACSHALRGDA